MIENIFSKDGVESNKLKYTSEANELIIQQMTIDEFITKNTMAFFKILKIDSSFLRIYPNLWKDNDSYKQALEFVQCLHVVNDAAERAVSLTKHLNLKTKSEEQMQAMCQVVKEHQKFSPFLTKDSLSQNFSEHIFKD